MSRIPKWLLLKELLSFDDVVKLNDNAPSSIETVLAQDCSEEMRHTFIFNCTFCPSICTKQFREYRREETARKSAREHIRIHIKEMNEKCSEEEKNNFITRNQLYQGTKSAQKRKVPADPVVPSKIRKGRKNQGETSNQTSTRPKKSDVKKEKRPKFTKLKRNQPSGLEDKLDTGDDKSCQIIEVTECDEMDQTRDIDHNQSQAQQEMSGTESLSDVNGDRVNCETQTEERNKEEETLLYKIAIKMFAVDRYQWNNIDEILDKVMKSEAPSVQLSQHDRELLTAAMRQWMNSNDQYDKLVKSHVSRPLTEQEKDTINKLTKEDWKNLEAASSTNAAAKMQLMNYAKLLLRDYECCPRKQKPRYCKHCGQYYTASTSLFTHLISVSGIRFWICGQCQAADKTDATFTRKYSLQYHILKEIGIPRYRCTHSGCSKTHNHTHHQKSHARQHTGEKHYACKVPSCTVQFSNRNTYGRHLLQVHNMILTKTNELKPIDATEAEKKVNDARLKARVRSKSKREQSSTKSNKLVESNDDDKKPKKVTIDENILCAANHFYSEVKREECIAGIVDATEEFKTDDSIQPSASQLLSGIARDVQKTSSLHYTKPTDNMMGGLNLLATVSNYMTTENYPALKNNPDEVKLSVEQIQILGKGQSGNRKSAVSSGQLADLKTLDTSSNGEKVTNNTAHNGNSTHPNFVCDIHASDAKKLKVIDKKQSKAQELDISASSGHSLELTDHSAGNFHPETSKDRDATTFPTAVHSGFITKLNPVLALGPKNTKTENASSLPTPTSPPTHFPAKVLRVIQSPVSHVNKVSTTVSRDSKGMFVQAIKLSPHRLVIPRTGPTHHCTTAVSVKFAPEPSSACVSGLIPGASSQVLTFGRNSVSVSTSSITKTPPSTKMEDHDDVKSKFVVPVSSETAVNSQESFQGERSSLYTAKSPLATVTPNVNVKNDTTLPGRIIAETGPLQGNVDNKGTITSTLPAAGGRNIQVLKVSDAASQLQLRSVSCISGTKYIVVTPTAPQRGNNSVASSK